MSTEHATESRLSLADFARYHDVARSTATRWKKAGHLVMEDDEVLVEPSDRVLEEQGLGRFRRTDDRNDDVTWAEARKRKELALAKKHELDVQERLGELLPKAAFVEAGGELLNAVRKNIVAIEGRWATAFPGTPPRQAAAVLRRVVHDLLEQLSGPAADALERGEPAPIPAPRPPDELPEGFPFRAILQKAGVGTWSGLLDLEDPREVHGIGPARAEKITAALEDRDVA